MLSSKKLIYKLWKHKLCKLRKCIYSVHFVNFFPNTFIFTAMIGPYIRTTQHGSNWFPTLEGWELYYIWFTYICDCNFSQIIMSKECFYSRMIFDQLRTKKYVVLLKSSTSHRSSISAPWPSLIILHYFSRNLLWELYQKRNCNKREGFKRTKMKREQHRNDFLHHAIKKLCL